MKNFLKEMWKDYLAAQQELSKMGIFTIYIPTLGSYTHVDQEQMATYQERIKERLNESS